MSVTGHPKDPISVIVATCDRPECLPVVVESLLAVEEEFELVIVDQSHDDRSRLAVIPLLHSLRVIYHRMPKCGLSSARNMGVQLSTGVLIAMTDDDCEVTPEWLGTMRAGFLANESIGVIFGNVLAGPHDAGSGIIPSYIRNEPYLASAAHEKNRVEGIGACMAFQKVVWERINGFDEMLGACSDFPAAEEGDFALRALRQGFSVLEWPDFRVTHHGFRTWLQGARLTTQYWYGTGAMFGKHLKLAPISTLRLLLGLAMRFLCGRRSLSAQSLRSAVTQQEQVSAFIFGILAGLAVPASATTGCFCRKKG